MPPIFPAPSFASSLVWLTRGLALGQGDASAHLSWAMDKRTDGHDGPTQMARMAYGTHMQACRRWAYADYRPTDDRWVLRRWECATRQMDVGSPPRGSHLRRDECLSDCSTLLGTRLVLGQYSSLMSSVGRGRVKQRQRRQASAHEAPARLHPPRDANCSFGGEGWH